MSSEMINITEASIGTDVDNLKKFTGYLGSMLLYVLKNPDRNPMALLAEKSSFFQNDYLKMMIMDHLHVYMYMKKHIIEKKVFVASKTGTGGKYEKKEDIFFTYPGKYKRVNPLVYYLLEYLCGISYFTKIFFITTDVINRPDIRNENNKHGSASILPDTYDNLEFMRAVTNPISNYTNNDPEMISYYSAILSSISGFRFDKAIVTSEDDEEQNSNFIMINTVFVSNQSRSVDWNFYRSIKGTSEGLIEHNNTELVSFFNSTVASIGQEIEAKGLNNNALMLSEINEKFRDVASIDTDSLNFREARLAIEQQYLNNKVDPVTKMNIVLDILKGVFMESHLNEYAPYSSNLKKQLASGEVPEQEKKEKRR